AKRDLNGADWDFFNDDVALIVGEVALFGEYVAFMLHYVALIYPVIYNVALCKCSSTGRPLGAYNLQGCNLKSMVYAGLMTSEDASVFDKGKWMVLEIKDVTPWDLGFKTEIGNQSQAVLHDALRALVDMLLVAMLIEDVPLVAQLVDTDTESDPEEAPSEAEESQPLGSRVPLMSEEFEASKPLGTRTVSSHSSVSSDSIAPLSPEHPLTHVSPTPTPT
ncbi:hypothetical protein Tco_1014558, partial [Tanacetum coccineum]